MDTNGFLQDSGGDNSSKRLYGLISLVVLCVTLVINLFTGRVADPTIVLVLGSVVFAAIGGSTAEFFANAKLARSAIEDRNDPKPR